MTLGAVGASGASGDKAIIRIGTKGTHTKAFMAGVRDLNATGGQTVLVNLSGRGDKDVAQMMGILG